MSKVEKRFFVTKSNNHFTIRTALPNDADRIISFTRNIMAEAPFLLTTEAEFKVTSEQQKQFLQDVFDSRGKLALAAEMEDEIIGFLDFHNGHKQRIQHQGSFGMSVNQHYRNKGVGKALLTVLLDWAKENPLIEKVCLEVFADNQHAIELYKKFGFVEEGRKRKAIKIDEQTYHDVLIMANFVK
ncbi:GNAT family N-acetyltransferase [Bacillus sp. Bva_UNVM-123]|uniref:N-acetyltransferase family protein n=1 Tax=Bacillus sp. Bva_UNVM-123 TaxID=2829798 RepID=UPI00391FB331